jgi:hypothetical protein
VQTVSYIDNLHLCADDLSQIQLVNEIENPIIARWYMSFDPISATEALKLLRICPMMDLTIFLLAFKE